MKKVFLIAFAVVIGLFLIAVTIRVSQSESTSVYNVIVPTEKAVAAYKDGRTVLTTEPRQNLSFDGYMRVYSILYVPDGEIQITVKTNRSTYQKLGTTEEDGFDFMLYDVTNEKEYRDYTEEHTFEGRYGYYRLVFEGYELTESSETEIIMFPKGKEEPYSYFKFHEPGNELEEYELSEKEIASLGE